MVAAGNSEVTHGVHGHAVIDQNMIEALSTAKQLMIDTMRMK